MVGNNHFGVTCIRRYCILSTEKIQTKVIKNEWEKVFSHFSFIFAPQFYHYAQFSAFVLGCAEKQRFNHRFSDYHDAVA